jgi:hypothetical protein
VPKTGRSITGHTASSCRREGRRRVASGGVWTEL